MKTIELSDEAYALVCGLVHPSDDIDTEKVVALDPTWSEVRSKFPLTDYAPPKEDT
jgi:hypothetical protein